MKGQLALMPAIKKLMDEVLAGPSMGDPIEGDLAAERTMIANAKKAGLLAAGVATQKYMMALEEQQEVLGALADIIIEVFAMESACLRAQKILCNQGEAAAKLPILMTRAYIMKAMEKVEGCARKSLAACSEGDDLRMQMVILRRMFKYEPFNVVADKRVIADRTIEAGKYVIV
jgi:butyryl-CoA dehydrogenase